MKEEPLDRSFELAYRLRISSGDGPDGQTHDAAGLIELMRVDAAFRDWERSGAEHHWRTGGCGDTERWIQLLVATARYFSDLIGGDVPILAPREVVDASVGIDRRADEDALLIGKSIRRAIRSQIRDATDMSNGALLAEFEKLLKGVVTNAVPASSKWLNTEQVAARLGLNRATVERKFRSGDLHGDKTAGNQWRTTEERLQRSPYLRKTNRRSELGG